MSETNGLSRYRPSIAPCECHDAGCVHHEGLSYCLDGASETLYRIDMLDVDGTPMCADCVLDALNSGLFTTQAERDFDIEDAKASRHAFHMEYGS